MSQYAAFRKGMTPGSRRCTSAPSERKSRAPLGGIFRPLGIRLYLAAFNFPCSFPDKFFRADPETRFARPRQIRLFRLEHLYSIVSRLRRAGKRLNADVWLQAERQV